MRSSLVVLEFAGLWTSLPTARFEAASRKTLRIYIARYTEARWDYIPFLKLDPERRESFWPSATAALFEELRYEPGSTVAFMHEWGSAQHFPQPDSTTIDRVVDWKIQAFKYTGYNQGPAGVDCWITLGRLRYGGLRSLVVGATQQCRSLQPISQDNRRLCVWCRNPDNWECEAREPTQEYGCVDEPNF